MAIPIAAEQVFEIGSFSVTNSLVNGWVTVLFFVVIAFLINRNVKQTPKGLQNLAEAILELILNFMDQVTNDRVKSRRFLPICGTLFLFILVSNWMGLIPGVGSIGVWGVMHDEVELIPLFRAATSDLNMTLAMGVGAVFLSHIVGVMTIGFLKHWGKFIQVGGIWKAIKSFGTEKIGTALVNVFISIVELAVGFIELMSEVAKMISLSLRLFGNIFAGEVLLWVFFSLIRFGLPVPFYFMELLVGGVQAMIFSTLVLVYLTVMTQMPHGETAEAH